MTNSEIESVTIVSNSSVPISDENKLPESEGIFAQPVSTDSTEKAELVILLATKL